MATLADELLLDFEDSGSEAGDDQQDGLPNELFATDGDADDTKMEDGDGVNDEDEDAEMAGVEVDGPNASEDPEETKARVEKMRLGAVRDVRSVAGLMKTLTPVLEKIAHFQSEPTPADIIGNIEEHPEYEVLTQANTLSASIDGEIALVHKFIRDHYSVRFPELETLITNPIEYAKVVTILGNGPFDASNIKALQTSTENSLGVTLKSVLEGPSLMIVTVEATTSKGRQMSDEELGRVFRACDMILSLDRAKKTLTEYVQSRMNIFAPNLTALLGSLTAAQLLNAAGGLKNLAKAPACNLPSWGSKKQANAALATNVGFRHQGFIFQSSILRGIPNDLKKQAIKKFANKAVICARMDSGHQYRDGSEGERLKDETLDNIDKIHQKPLNKGGRALPAPDDKPSRKRGGRRARKAKEALAMTDLRKQQNRMAFGKEEMEVGYGTGDGTKGLGMIGLQDGRLRATQVDQRTRAKLSAKSKGWGGASSLNGGASSLMGGGAGNISLAAGKGLRTSGVGSTLGSSTAGTVSSLAFGAGQGLSLADPEMQAKLKRKRAEEEDRWFKGGTFTQVGGSAPTSNGDGVFAKPALPPAKKVNTGK